VWPKEGEIGMRAQTTLGGVVLGYAAILSTLAVTGAVGSQREMSPL
jgi:hypothetical protein